MRYDISVIIPCLNEENNLNELVDRIQNLFKKKELRGQIILIDDGSNNKTKEVINLIKKKYSDLILKTHDKNLGIVESWRSGLSLAEGEFISLIDSDLQYLPEDIWRMYREIKYSMVDIVHGFRSSVKNTKQNLTSYNKLLNIIVRTLFKIKLFDPISSFIVCRKEVLENLLIQKNKYKYYQILLIAIAKARGYTIRQVEILFQDRLSGKSFFEKRKFYTWLMCIKEIFTSFIEFKLKNKTDRALEEFLIKNRPQKKDKELNFTRKIWFRLFILTMPLHHWMISRHAEKYYNELKESQWLSPAQIEKLQEIKLRKMVDHAYYHVPYYREIFKKLSLNPSDIKTIDDLRKIPLLNKQDVRENIYFDMLSDNHDKKKILKITTSGSTGEPFVCFADKHQLEIRWASTLRSMEWTGYRFGDRQMRLWHQTIGMSFVQIIKEKIDAIFNRRIFIPAFEMSDKNINKFAKKIEKIKPTFIDGYAESLNFLAHYLKKFPFNNLKIKGMMSSAQILPKQSRDIIEKTFNCKVFDKYGSREFSGIAYECEAHEGHHIVSESYIVEILKEGEIARPGEIGEVVITDLNNFCMPLIRYRVGDLAVAMDNNKQCSCGRGLPRIGDIEGRVQAIIIGSNGNYIPGTFFAHFFKDYDLIIKQYQIQQKEVGCIELKIIKTNRFDSEIFTECINILRNFLGENTLINIEFVDKIEMIRTGKHQGSISKLKIDFQADNRAFVTYKK